MFAIFTPLGTLILLGYYLHKTWFFNVYIKKYGKKHFSKVNLYQTCNYFSKSHTNVLSRPYMMQLDKKYVVLPCK